MYKFIFAIITIVFCLMLQALQFDEQVAVQTLFQVKHAVNRAAHAAAGQIEEEGLAQGQSRIDEARAYSTGLHYLQQNLYLDENNDPLPHSLLKDEVDILVFEVIQDETFPYTYSSDAYSFTVTLDRPGVILIVGVSYPKVFSLIGDIHWTVKGTAQLYPRSGDSHL